MPTDDAIEALAQVAAQHESVRNLLVLAGNCCYRSDWYIDRGAGQRIVEVLSRADAIRAGRRKQRE